MKEVKDTKPFTQKIADKLDDLVGFFSPKVGLNRKMYRFSLARANSYRAAEKNRARDNWLPTGGSADEDLLRDLPALREKSRDLNRNDAYAAGITESIVTNVVGIGIRPQSRVDNEVLGMSEDQVDLFQKSAERSWHRWVEFSDLTGRMDFYGIQHLVERQILENGEVFILPLMVDTPESPYMFKLQVIEADRVDTPSDKRSDKKIRAGIELDDNGRPVAYWVRKSHPGEMRYRTHSGNSSENYIRYPAFNEMGRRNIMHLYYMKRPGQTRGIPFFAPVINYFKDLSDSIEAELVSEKIAACFSVFIKRNNPTGLSLSNTNRIENGKRLETLEPGVIEYLNIDEEIQFADPKRPGSNFTPFVELILRAIGSALNLPFEIVIRDFTRSNYSSARAALQEARRFFKERQKFLERELCQPVWDMLLEEAFLIGELPVVKFYQDRINLTRARWISPGWGWIDPTKEVDAARSAVEGLMSSHADEMAAQGKDWEEVYEQLAREKKKREELRLDIPATTSKKMILDTNQNSEEEKPAVAGKR